jgi:hypothetical protein
MNANMHRLSIVDVVPGNARRSSRELLQASGVMVNFEIAPDPVIQLAASQVSQAVSNLSESHSFAQVILSRLTRVAESAAPPRQFHTRRRSLNRSIHSPQ